MKINTRWSLGYELLKYFVGGCLRLYYRKIEIHGRENIPPNAPVIYAPNHQNALIDPLLIICFTKKQPLSLARASAFKKPLVRRILNGLKMLPVFRPRDGISTMGRNEEIFAWSVKMLKANNPVIIFPEGNHSFQRRLRSLKKGLMRIAFRTEEEIMEIGEKGVQIVPVGFDYVSHFNFRTRVLIRYGKPIPVARYMDHYRENPQEAMMALRADLSKEIRKLILHIEPEEICEPVNSAVELYVPKICRSAHLPEKNLLKRLECRQQAAAAFTRFREDFPEAFRDLLNMLPLYLKNLRKAGLRDHVVAGTPRPWHRLLLMLAGLLMLSPVFLAGFALNGLPYLAVDQGVNRKTTENKFHATLKFTLGVVAFLAWYLLLGAAWLLLIPLPAWSVVLFIPGSIALGLAAFHYWIAWQKFKGHWHYAVRYRQHDSHLDHLELKRREIFQILDQAWLHYRNSVKP